jgi:hypothetical protein
VELSNIILFRVGVLHNGQPADIFYFGGSAFNTILPCVLEGGFCLPRADLIAAALLKEDPCRTDHH